MIYLDLKPRTTQSRVIIGKNKFNRNSGYLESNVIYIRARGPSSGSVYT